MTQIPPQANPQQQAARPGGKQGSSVDALRKAASLITEAMTYPDADMQSLSQLQQAVVQLIQGGGGAGAGPGGPPGAGGAPGGMPPMPPGAGPGGPPGAPPGGAPGGGMPPIPPQLLAQLMQGGGGPQPMGAPMNPGGGASGPMTGTDLPNPDELARVLGSSTSTQ